VATLADLEVGFSKLSYFIFLLSQLVFSFEKIAACQFIVCSFEGRRRHAARRRTLNFNDRATFIRVDT
jgi:hypothetical protein